MDKLSLRNYECGVLVKSSEVFISEVFISEVLDIVIVGLLIDSRSSLGHDGLTRNEAR